ncbi:hypothetical protein pb186bvf_012225 [Paramecium bursaria]
MDQVFSRQINIEDWYQQKIVDQKVLILGVGGIGTVVLTNMLRLGVKEIAIIDYDHVEYHNLNRQSLYTIEDVGKQKVDQAFENSKFHNVGGSNIQRYDIDAVKNWDKIVELAQNSTAIFNCIDYGDYWDAAVQSLCVKLNIPMFIAGSFAQSMMIEVYNSSPCYVCMADNCKLEFLEQIKPDIILTLKTIEFLPPNQKPVGKSHQVLCQTAGNLLSQFFLNYVNGLSRETKKILFYLSTFEIVSFPSDKRPDCPICIEVQKEQKLKEDQLKQEKEQELQELEKQKKLQEQKVELENSKDQKETQVTPDEQNLNKEQVEQKDELELFIQYLQVLNNPNIIIILLIEMKTFRKQRWIPKFFQKIKYFNFLQNKISNLSKSFRISWYECYKTEFLTKIYTIKKNQRIMHFIIIFFLRFSGIAKGYCSTIVDLPEGTSFVASSWLDDSGNSANTIYPCTELKAGPYLGGFTENFKKTYSNLPPHYQITLSVDILFGQYWYQVGNYFQILADGSQIYKLSNIYTVSFDWPADYCKQNQFYGFSFSQKYYTIKINFNHQSSNLLIQFQGTFDQYYYFVANVYEQVSIKNLVIQTSDCDQSCLTCSGPNANQCLTCQQGTPTSGICTCSTGYVYQNGCVPSCPTYYVAQNNICQIECSLNCNTCSQSLCTSCIGYNVGGTCYSSCPAYSLSCVDYKDIPLYRSYYLGKYFYNLNLDDISQFSFTGTSLSGQLYSIYNYQLILGGFGVWGSGQYSISYTNISPHKNIRIYAQLYFIDQWNGENIQVLVDGVVQSTNTFTSVLNTNNQMYRNYGDQISNVQLSIPHLSDSLTIIFKTSLNQNSYTASAGISNLFVLADYCDNNCQICGANYCTTCNLGYNLIHNRCILCNALTKRNTDCSCVTSYFDDGSNQICQQCSNLCSQCTSASVCTACSDINKVLPSCSSCKPGYYLSGLSCNLCDSSCSTCANGSSCTICASGKQFNIDGFLCSNPVPICQSNQFVNSANQCQNCSNQCLTCTINSQNCQTCNVDRINTPICSCKYGYYSDYTNSLCYQCNIICSDCESSSTNCKVCAANRVNIPTCDCPIDGISKLDIGYAECSTCEQTILQIQFSDDLESIIINFGKQLYEYQNCINLFNDTTKFGENPSCQINQNLLTLYLGSNAIIKVGDVIVFSQIIFEGCTQYTKTINNQVQGPLNQLNPIVQFDKEDITSLVCEDSTINVINILNSGQRDLTYIGWTLQTTQGSGIQQLWNQQLGASQLVIQGSLLSPDQSIQLKLTYQNFIGLYGFTLINIQVVSQISLTPSLQIPTIYTYLQNTIYLMINKQICNEIIQPYEINLTIYNNQSIVYNQVHQSSLYSTAFILQEGQFQKDQTYQVLAQLTFKQQQYSINDTFIPVDIQDYIQIHNGNRQIGFRQNFDISVQTSLNSSDFQWGCFIITNNKPCNLQLNNTNIQQIKKSTFQVFQLVQFTVQSQNLQSTAIINMIELEVPQIQINMKQQYISRINNYYDELFFEISYPIQINPELLFCFINILFQDQSITFRVYYNQFKFKLWDYIGNQTLDQLQIQFNVFNPDYSVPSTASQQLQFNIPPQNCQIQVNDTIFNIIGCYDNNQPLQYLYVYYLNDQSYYFDQNKSIIIQGIIIQNYTTQSQLNFNVPLNDSWMMIQVRDNFQGISNISIKLNQSQVKLDQFQTILQNLIETDQLYTKIISYLLTNNASQAQFQQIYEIIRNVNFTLPQLEQIKYLLYQQMNTSLIDINSDYTFIGSQINTTIQEYKQLYSTYTNYYNEVMKLNIKSIIQKQSKFLGLLYDLNLQHMQTNKRRQLFESQDILIQVDQLQSALTTSSLVNEEPEQIQTNQFNTSVIKLTSSQFFNTKGNSSSIYQYGQTTYNSNPLQNTSSFLQYQQSYNTQLYIPTLLIDNQSASNYPSNFSFQNPQNNSQQCIIKINSYWSADACQQQLKNSKTVCICQQVSPITIVEAFQQIENSIKVLFSSDAIDNINNLQVQKLAFTYIILFYTIVYIVLVMVGNKLDKKQFDTPDVEEVNNNKIYPIREIIINEDAQSESQNDQILGSQGDLKIPKQHQSMKQIQIQNTENGQEGSQREIQFYPRKKQKQVTKMSIQPEDERFSVDRHDQTDIKSQFRTPNGIIRFKSNFSKIDEIIENSQKCLNSKIEQSILTESQALKIFYQQWHDLISVYYRFDKNHSRIHRSTLIYISNIGQICILTVFGQTLSINTLIALSILQGLFRFIFKRVITYLLNHQNPTFRVLGGQLVCLSTGIFFYLILASIAAYKDVMTANLWAASYLGSFILNYFLYSSMGLLGYYILLRRFYKNSLINKLLNIILDQQMIQLIYGE